MYLLAPDPPLSRASTLAEEEGAYDRESHVTSACAPSGQGIN